MRNVILWLMLAAILVVINLSILAKEKTLREGETVLLTLAPVDPRSLLQGDYMVLRYAISREAFAAADGARRAGRLVVALDANGVATFVRLDDGSPLAGNEHRLYYRLRAGTLRLASDAYFFQEGTAETYARARYGELKVDADGDALLIGLRDSQFNRLE